MKCPKCKGEMDQGKFATKNQMGIGIPVAWVKGVDTLWISKLKEPRNLVVIRCTSCGYLESYAK